MIKCTKKQLNHILTTLGLQSMLWGSLIADAEYNKAYDEAEHYENASLMGLQISTKLYHRDMDISKLELELLIHLYEECIESTKQEMILQKHKKKK